MRLVLVLKPLRSVFSSETHSKWGSPRIGLWQYPQCCRPWDLFHLWLCCRETNNDRHRHSFDMPNESQGIQSTAFQRQSTKGTLIDIFPPHVSCQAKECLAIYWSLTIWNRSNNWWQAWDLKPSWVWNELVGSCGGSWSWLRIGWRAWSIHQIIGSLGCH